MLLVSSLVRFRRLPAYERPFVWRAFGGLSLAALALALIDFKRILGALPAPTLPRGAHVPPERIVALVAAVAARLPWEPSCLHRSIVAAWLLGRSGHPWTIVLGLRRPGDRPLDAHAWIEIDGRPAEALPAGHWTSLMRWPPAASR